MLAVVMLLAAFVRTAGSLCIKGDDRSDSTPANVTIVLFGRTGVGKSALVDFLAGGQKELAHVGRTWGDSETSQSCLIGFDFMSGQPAKFPAERWEVLDVPGISDTRGDYFEVQNEEKMDMQLRQLGSADAVVLVWKVDEKDTPEVLSPVEFIRSNFGPSIWHRLIMVYTFWNWEEDCALGLCTCKHRSNLDEFHKATMQKFVETLRNMFVVGDKLCDKSAGVTKECFPHAGDIPHIGVNVNWKRLNVMRKRNLNILDPNDRFYTSLRNCTSDGIVDLGANDMNDALELYHLRDIVRRSQQAPHYQRIDLSTVRNCWLSCKYAQNMLQQPLPSYRNHSYIVSLGNNIHGCIRGGVKNQMFTLKTLMEARYNASELDFWIRVAFALDQPEFVTPDYGFDEDVAAVLREYPDLRTYILCQDAVSKDLLDASEMAEEISGCWLRLTKASPRKTPETRLVLDELVRSYESRSPILRREIAMRWQRKAEEHPGCCPDYGLCADACGGNDTLGGCVAMDAPKFCGRPMCESGMYRCCVPCSQATPAWAWWLVLFVFILFVVILVYLCCRSWGSESPDDSGVPLLSI